MKNWVVILVSIILLILDNSLMPFLAIRGAFPSLLFIFAISYSLVKGGIDAVIVGAFSGILQDIFFYNGMGINSLSNLLLCVLAAFVGENIFKNKRLIPVLTMFIVSIIKVGVVYIFIKVNGNDINIRMALLSSIYNAIVLFFGYNFVLKLCDKEYKKSSWRFR
ncbi:rod shape-determining protein MreD [Clostridium gasigenes]|uniref:rod shape-determining protein MreD n=1 Tax=Clostridium gasigenes TaxID=94869 RepID=UPI001C0C402C|nr:rod shape-determining protein MreD [Clostridium gasigenes]MBU3108249.1 rod shape-determining protein MreD [Clostridium gasigenes]